VSPAAATPAGILEVIFLVDVSGSMSDGATIQSLNAAMEEAVPSWRRLATGARPTAVELRVSVFGSSAEWAVPQPVPVVSFWWPDLTAEHGDLTELGSGLNLVTDALPDAPGRQPPALVLVSDGMPTDVSRPTFAEALAALDRHPVGSRAARAAIAVGTDAHRPTLEAFVAPAAGTVIDGSDPGRLATAARTVIDHVLRTEPPRDEGDPRE
jgi:uncharacterized protein YegL